MKSGIISFGDPELVDRILDVLGESKRTILRLMSELEKEKKAKAEVSARADIMFNALFTIAYGTGDKQLAKDALRELYVRDFF